MNHTSIVWRKQLNYTVYKCLLGVCLALNESLAPPYVQNR